MVLVGGIVRRSSRYVYYLVVYKIPIQGQSYPWLKKYMGEIKNLSFSGRTSAFLYYETFAGTTWWIRIPEQKAMQHHRQFDDWERETYGEAVWRSR